MPVGRRNTFDPALESDDETTTVVNKQGQTVHLFPRAARSSKPQTASSAMPDQNSTKKDVRRTRDRVPDEEAVTREIEERFGNEEGDGAGVANSTEKASGWMDRVDQAVAERKKKEKSRAKGTPSKRHDGHQGGGKSKDEHKGKDKGKQKVKPEGKSKGSKSKDKEDDSPPKFPGFFKVLFSSQETLEREIKAYRRSRR